MSGLASQGKTPWAFCLPAIAMLLDDLPLLYRYAEDATHGLVVMGLRSVGFTVLRLHPGGHPDQIEATLDPNLATMAVPRAERLGRALALLESQIGWAAGLPCAEQAPELRWALIGFRGLVDDGTPSGGAGSESVWPTGSLG